MITDHIIQTVWVTFTAVMLSILFTGAIGAANAQQTPADTTCHEGSGISWTLNPEPDMDHYNLYISRNTPVDKTTATIAAIAHDPSKAVLGTDGKLTITEKLGVVLQEGDTYFAVSAVDHSNNESPLSNEVGCKVDFKPGQPQDIIIRVTIN